MSQGNFFLQQLKQLDMVDWLEKEGHSPTKIRGNDYWYLSPLRMEKTPSFKVNRKMNVWYDHGLGKGGNLVDFGILYFNCSVKEFLERMNVINISFHQPLTPMMTPSKEDAGSKIKILEVGLIQHVGLVDYLGKRFIPLEIAQKYCRQVDYEVSGKQYSAIGFQNNSGGFELRSAYFKGSNSPKDATLIQQAGAERLVVTEGFFDFLSFQCINLNQDLPAADYLVLNSLAFIENNMSKMETCPEVKLLLDNDLAGDAATSKLLARSANFKDGRQSYQGSKDLNQ